MKKLLFIGLITFSLVSCTMKTYMSNELYSNYKLKMSSKTERALVEKIPVYLSESEIQGQFTVLSLNTYNPIVIPVLGNRKKIILEQLYKKAVKVAEELNGNGVLIIDDSHFKVLSITFNEAYLSEIADENLKKLAYSDSIQKSREKNKIIVIEGNISQDTINKTVVIKGNNPQDSVNIASNLQYVDESNIHFNIGDKVTFLEKIDIKGKLTAIQITNGKVVDVTNGSVKISFKFNGKTYEATKRKSEVQLSTL